MTVIKHLEQRVAVFIDTQNLYHSAKNLYKAKVNFGKLVDDVVANRKLVRSLAYVISSENGDEQSFFEALVKAGIEIKTKDLQVFSSGAKKADWDVGIAVDALAIAPKVDTIILIAGDGDFVPLVEALKIRHACQVEVISFGKSTSSKLIESADEFIDLDADHKKYLIMNKKGIRIIKGSSKNKK